MKQKKSCCKPFKRQEGSLGAYHVSIEKDRLTWTLPRRAEAQKVRANVVPSSEFKLNKVCDACVKKPIIPIVESQRTVFLITWVSLSTGAGYLVRMRPQLEGVADLKSTTTHVNYSPRFVAQPAESRIMPTGTPLVKGSRRLKRTRKSHGRPPEQKIPTRRRWSVIVRISRCTGMNDFQRDGQIITSPEDPPQM
jgi:hypothetical protein